MKTSSVLTTLATIGFIGAANAADISIYYAPWCPHCHHARDFIKDSVIYEYPKISVTEIDVTKDENKTTFAGALNKCKYSSGGVPVIVIGEKCFQGYSDKSQDELRAAIESDLSDADKATAKSVQDAMKENADNYRKEHSEDVAKIIEYTAPVMPESAETQEESDSDSKKKIM